MTRGFFALCAALIAAMVVGCVEKPDVPGPNHSTLLFKRTLNLDQQLSHWLSNSIQGTRRYYGSPGPSGCTLFSAFRIVKPFVEPPELESESGGDWIQLTINDHAGVRPGFSYSYTFTQADESLKTKGTNLWQVTTCTPETSPVALDLFKFTFVSNPRASKTHRCSQGIEVPAEFRFDQSVRTLGGTYLLSASQRDIAVSVTFHSVADRPHYGTCGDSE